MKVMSPSSSSPCRLSEAMFVIGRPSQERFCSCVIGGRQARGASCRIIPMAANRYA